MKILNTEQIRQLDAFTIQQEPISSLDLMERASQAFVRCFCDHFANSLPISIFCGKGNNGGDGLAIARILSEKLYSVSVYILEYNGDGTANFVQNLQKLQPYLIPTYLHTADEFPEISVNTVCVDAILGSGLSRAASGLIADVITRLNDFATKIVSVDIASGLFADRSNEINDVIVKPFITITFQLPKLAFMMPQNALYVGDWHVVDIGLNQEFILNAATLHFYTNQNDAEARLIPRQKFSHKGTFGHALLVAGSFGKIGAAVLAGKACLRSGVGLLTMHIPGCGYEIVQIAIPEAMASVDSNPNCMSELPELDTYSSIGMGPGIGQEQTVMHVLEKLLLLANVPLVIDADALNILSQNKRLLPKLPENTILTPHPKEFQRLAGETRNEFERLALASQFTKQYGVIICLKGANTAVVLPNGEVYFNSTGNPGMATGGTGDVLTGIITAFLAQKYKTEDAAILGVYAHGLAGDRAAQQRGQSALIASDVIEWLRI